MFYFTSRSRANNAGPYLNWRLRLFIGGAILGLFGIYLERSLMITASIILLSSGLVLSFLEKRRAQNSGDYDGDAES